MKIPKPVISPASTRLGRAIDTFVEAISPERALQRGRARTMLSYGAAERNRDRRGAINTMFGPDSPKVQRDAVTMMFEARDLAENVGFVKGHLRKVQLYGAGTLTYEPNSGDPAWDSEATDYMKMWQRVAHTGLEHTFTRLMQLGLIGMTRDRDYLLVWQRDEDMLRLAPVEADQIGELYHFKNEPGYISGVYRNGDGTKRGYKVYERVGDMQYGNPQFVAAQDGLFFVDPMRNSARGVTAYDTAITNIRDKFEILGYEKIIVKEISTTGIVTYTEQGIGAPEFDYDRTETTSDGVTSYIRDVSGVAREYRGIGEKFEVIPHNRPSDTFRGFLKMLDSENCQGLNLPYGFIIDPSEPGGVAARIIAHIANREFERIQRDVMEPNLNRVSTIVLADAIERKEIGRHPRFAEGIWMFPPPPTADIQRESDIAIREVRAGLSNYTEQYAIYGQSRKRQWEIKMIEAVERHRLAWEATKRLADMKIDSVVNPDEIAAMSDNPAITDGEKTAMDTYGVGVRAGAITPTLEDEIEFRKRNGLPNLTEEAKRAWAKDSGTRRPITIVNSDGSRNAPGGAQTEEDSAAAA